LRLSIADLSLAKNKLCEREIYFNRMDGRRREAAQQSESFRLVSEPTIEEEERDEFNVEEQAPIFRTRQPSILHQRSSSFSGTSISGRGKAGGIKASAPLDDSEDAGGLNLSNGLERRASRRTSFNRKSSGITQPDAEQMILQQVLAKYSESSSSLDLKKESRKQIRQMLEEERPEEDKKKADLKAMVSPDTAS
jgi:hypothetical protein